MPRGQRDGHSTLAKSLPVTVPAFPSIRRAVQDQNDDQVTFYTIFPTLYNKGYLQFLFFF